MIPLITRAIIAFWVQTDQNQQAIVRATPAVLGVDASHFQNDAISDHMIDWNAVKAAGKTFVFVKASEGMNSSESPKGTPYTVINVNGAKAAQLVVGTYHLARPDLNPTLKNAESEAINFLNRAWQFIGSEFLPPALDMENDYVNAYNNNYPNGPDLSDWVLRWLIWIGLTAA